MYLFESLVDNIIRSLYSFMYKHFVKKIENAFAVKFNCGWKSRKESFCQVLSRRVLQKYHGDLYPPPPRPPL